MTKRLPLITSLSLLLILLAPALALAEQPVPLLSLGFETQAPAGNRLVVAAYLLDPAGNPISDQAVSFSTDAEFMNTVGDVSIGEAITNDNGLAYILYVPKSLGEHTITARFAGNEVFAPVSASSPVTVTAGQATFEAERPFRIPGADIRLVVAALSTVWGLYFLVTIYFWLIRRSGERQGPSAEGIQ